MKVKMTARADSFTSYRSVDGAVLSRETCLTPNGNGMNGRWVLRDNSGEMIDWGKYRSDIAERNDLELFEDFG